MASTEQVVRIGLLLLTQTEKITIDRRWLYTLANFLMKSVIYFKLNSAITRRLPCVVERTTWPLRHDPACCRTAVVRSSSSTLYPTLTNAPRNAAKWRPVVYIGSWTVARVGHASRLRASERARCTGHLPEPLRVPVAQWPVVAMLAEIKATREIGCGAHMSHSSLPS